MSDGYPSMTALLGLLAVAGYQNRDKIAEWLGGATKASGQGAPGQGAPGQSGSGQQVGADSGLASILGHLGGTLGGGGAGGFLAGGLSELAERFKVNGHGETAQSWIGSGQNREIAPNQLEQAIGPDVLQRLSQQTGFSKDELLSRLSRDLPQAVDRYTPDGRVPA